MTVSDVIQARGLERIDLLKIDCEGGELECLRGVLPEHRALIQQVVVEVHDQTGELEEMSALLREFGLTRQVIEQEEALRATKLYNIFATREVSS